MRVRRYTLDGKYIDTITFSSKYCSKNGYSYNSTRLAVRPSWDYRRKIYSSFGIIWIAEDDFSEIELIRKIKAKSQDPNYNPKYNKRARRIAQIDAYTGQLIHVWDSINQAGKTEETGYYLPCIVNCLAGKQNKHAGCYWKYESDIL